MAGPLQRAVEPQGSHLPLASRQTPVPAARYLNIPTKAWHPAPGRRTLWAATGYPFYWVLAILPAGPTAGFGSRERQSSSGRWLTGIRGAAVMGEIPRPLLLRLSLYPPVTVHYPFYRLARARPPCETVSRCPQSYPNARNRNGSAFCSPIFGRWCDRAADYWLLASSSWPSIG
jgi:hypothetical protein